MFGATTAFVSCPSTGHYIDETLDMRAHEAEKWLSEGIILTRREVGDIPADIFRHIRKNGTKCIKYFNIT